ncbi:MAG: hypothetical protein ACHBN1_35875 [Heteroscytonema crispum UTEX LB 1556]
MKGNLFGGRSRVLRLEWCIPVSLLRAQFTLSLQRSETLSYFPLRPWTSASVFLKSDRPAAHHPLWMEETPFSPLLLPRHMLQPGERKAPQWLLCHLPSATVFLKRIGKSIASYPPCFLNTDRFIQLYPALSIIMRSPIH